MKTAFNRRKHKTLKSKNEVVTGKQLKEFVKQFKDDELVTALFINEKIIRDEHTDGWDLQESHIEFDKIKMTSLQVKEILQKIHTWDLNEELGWEQINKMNDKF
tara:strand:- start:233 stop:544 length:312 start_codon:yes stop_codon:yes gene_type:complete